LIAVSKGYRMRATLIVVATLASLCIGVGSLLQIIAGRLAADPHIRHRRVQNVGAAMLVGGIAVLVASILALESEAVGAA
jgi:hypothetical protein